MFEFLLLGLIKVVFRRAEIGAGINHAFAQVEGVEIIGNVVVIGHRLAVALERMAFTAQFGRAAARDARVHLVGQAVQLTRDRELALPA